MRRGRMSEASWIMDDGQALALTRMNFFFQSTSLVSQVILVYDYFCTLDQEIEFIWSRPVSLGSFLFFVNRYLPAVDTILMNTIFELKFATFASDECKSFIQSIAWLMFAGVAVSEFILTIRTAAMWHRNPAMQLTFGCLVIIFLAPAILFMYKEMSSLEVAPAGPNFGCIAIKSKNTIYIVFSILALYEFVIAMFTAIKAYQHVRSTNSSWVLQLYTEGLLFYAYMLGADKLPIHLRFLSLMPSVLERCPLLVRRLNVYSGLSIPFFATGYSLQYFVVRGVQY